MGHKKEAGAGLLQFKDKAAADRMICPMCGERRVYVLLEDFVFSGRWHAWECSDCELTDYEPEIEAE